MPTDDALEISILKTMADTLGFTAKVGQGKSPDSFYSYFVTCNHCQSRLQAGYIGEALTDRMIRHRRKVCRVYRGGIP